MKKYGVRTVIVVNENTKEKSQITDTDTKEQNDIEVTLVIEDMKEGIKDIKSLKL